MYFFIPGESSKPSLQAQLKINSVGPVVDCEKVEAESRKHFSKARAEKQPEEEDYCHKYKHSNFMFSSEYTVTILWMDRNGHNVCGMHSESVPPGFSDFAIVEMNAK